MQKHAQHSHKQATASHTCPINAYGLRRAHVPRQAGVTSSISWLGCQDIQPSRSRVIVWAKGGKGPKGKQSKLAGLLAKKADAEKKTVASPDQYRDPEIRALLLFICNSYYKHTKKPLIEAEFDVLPDAIFNAPFILLAHDRQAGVTDPRFIYANRAALETWEGTWDNVIGMFSRLSASDNQEIQDDRNQLLATAGNTGVVTGYTGWRKSLAGKNFKILDVTQINIEDADGEVIGQAAIVPSIELEDGTIVTFKGYEEETAAAAAEAAAQMPPSEEEIAAAEAAVKQWGDYVRTLKEQHGLTNKDPQVQEAVGNLQAWKTQLATLQQRLDAALAAAKAAFDDEDDDE